MSAVFAHGDLRLYLLHLLSGGAKHGYELIRLISDRFGGTYSPSAGTVYPRLAKLEEEGLVASSREGRTTRYELTDVGTGYVSAHADEIAALERSVSESVRSLADEVRGSVKDAMRTLRADLAAARDQAPSAPGAADSSGHPSESGGNPEAADRAARRLLASEVDRDLARLRQDARGWLRETGADREAVRSVRDEIAASRERIRLLLGR